MNSACFPSFREYVQNEKTRGNRKHLEIKLNIARTEKFLTNEVGFISPQHQQSMVMFAGMKPRLCMAAFHDVLHHS